MFRYILKRLLWLIVVVVGVAIVIFTIMYFTPGDPAVIILGSTATPAELEAERELLGLNKPYIVQLGQFLNQLFIHFDLGHSYINDRSVMKELLSRAPNTLKIAFICMAIQIVIGIPTGVLAAVKRNKLFDRISMIASIILVSIPGFWLALMLVLLFSLKLGWLPAFGIGGITFLILPCISNSTGGVATQLRMTRSSMLETIHSDYVVMARAKGLSELKILFKYTLPNALIPVITMIGGALAGCLGGAVIVETVFAIPGTGLYITNAIANRDYPVVRGSVVLLSIVFAVVMLLVDLAYAFIDPRIKAQYENQGGKRKKKEVPYE